MGLSSLGKPDAVLRGKVRDQEDDDNHNCHFTGLALVFTNGIPIQDRGRGSR